MALGEYLVRVSVVEVLKSLFSYYLEHLELWSIVDIRLRHVCLCINLLPMHPLTYIKHVEKKASREVIAKHFALLLLTVSLSLASSAITSIAQPLLTSTFS